MSRRVHDECTTSARRVHDECTTSARRVHDECTTSARRVHDECTTSARRVHDEWIESKVIKESQSTPCVLRVLSAMKMTSTNIRIVGNPCVGLYTGYTAPLTVCPVKVHAGVGRGAAGDVRCGPMAWRHQVFPGRLRGPVRAVRHRTLHGRHEARQQVPLRVPPGGETKRQV